MPEKKLKTYAIILAAGQGNRYGTLVPKQFLKVAGKLVIEHTVSTFESNPNVDKIIIVTLDKYLDKVEELVIKNGWKKIYKILIGGDTRQESSFIGINSIEDKEAYVLIHDAVRPLVSNRIINDVISALHEYNAVDVAIPSFDTLIKVNNKNFIAEIPKRRFFLRGQTPQGFLLSVIKKAHQMAKKDNFTDVTDDCSLVLHYNLSKIFVVPGDEFNVKITKPIDLFLVDKLFQLKTIKLFGKEDISSLKGKVGVIFGSTSGIGKAIYDLCKKYGIKCFGFSRSLGVDIRKEEEVKSALESVYSKEGRIDFVIVTAAILIKKPLFNLSFEEIHSQIETNYVGSINVAKHSFKFLKESKGHLILFTSSSYSLGRPFYSIYSSSKAAIANFVQAISQEWSAFKIKVNAICPERTATPMRFKNFGKEPKDTLLDPKLVAEITLKVLLKGISGEIIEIKKER